MTFRDKTLRAITKEDNSMRQPMQSNIDPRVTASCGASGQSIFPSEYWPDWTPGDADAKSIVSEINSNSTSRAGGICIKAEEEFIRLIDDLLTIGRVHVGEQDGELCWRMGPKPEEKTQ